MRAKSLLLSISRGDGGAVFNIKWVFRHRMWLSNFAVGKINPIIL